MAEVVFVFLRLGLTAYGGPAAHIAIMQNEVVQRRKWLNDQQFLDLVGATHLIPGPNSTEMAIHLGFLRAGWPGLILGGASFVLPAMLIVMGLAWAYQRFGTTPQVGWLLYGIKPVVIAIIAQALILLGKNGVKSWLLALFGVTVLALYLLGINELLLLFSAGMSYMIIRNFRSLIKDKVVLTFLPPLFFVGVPAQAAGAFSLGTLFLIFLKIGAILYGGGYVLLAFLHADFVERLGWLTEQQLLDAVAIGQVTPGPLFTTATFIGYQLGGVAGALLSTLAFFLPGFIFVALSNPYIPRMRASAWFGALLDGVNVAALSLMAGVTIQIARAVFIDPISVGIALIAALLVFRWKINTTWLVFGGGLIGLLAGWLR
jgi:chromate transporter